MGFVPVGARAVRVDVLEQVLREFDVPAESEGFVNPKEIASRLGIAERDLPRLLGFLGYGRNAAGVYVQRRARSSGR